MKWRWLLTIGFVVFACACADDFDNTAAKWHDPGPAPDQAQDEGLGDRTGDDWYRIELADLSPHPPRWCGEPQWFRVDETGAWSWKWCAYKASGRLPREESAALEERISKVLGEGFSEKRCSDDLFTGRRSLSLLLRPDRDERLHDMQTRGNCFYAHAESVLRLEHYLARLRAKYAQAVPADEDEVR